MKKSILNPTKEVGVLRAMWGLTRVERLQKITEQVCKVIKCIQRMMKEKTGQRARGYLNYYLSFGRYDGKQGSEGINETKYMFALLEVKNIKLKYSKEGKGIEVYIDATKTRTGWVSR